MGPGRRGHEVIALLWAENVALQQLGKQLVPSIAQIKSRLSLYLPHIVTKSKKNQNEVGTNNFCSST